MAAEQPAASVDWIGPDEREERLIEQFARDMHSRTSGDWGAAGWITQQAFRSAAVSAVRELNKAGFDLLDILPKGAQGRV